MARLVVNPGSPVAWEIQLKPGLNFIGRGQNNDFKIADPSVSSSHCQVMISGSSATLKDLGSTNGTYVNRAPVQEATLQNGQAIHLGGVELLYYADAPTGAAPAGLVGAVPPPAPAMSPIGVQRPIGAPVPAAPGHIELPPLAAPAPVGTEIIAASATRPPPLNIRPTVAVAPPAPAPIPRPSAAPPPRAGASQAAAAGPHFCKFHPKTPGRYFCNHCQLYFCEFCVTSREVGEAQAKFCRKCGNECVAVQVQTARPASSRGFFPLLPGAFVYPFRGSGVLILVVAAVILSLRAGMYSLFAQIAAIGYLFCFMQSIIHATANGEAEMPELPGFEDAMGGFLRLAGCILLSFGAALVLAYFAVFQEQEMAAIGIIPAIAFGCVYFPMALLAVAMKDSVAAANPLVVMPAIFKVPLEYLVTVVLLGVVFGTNQLGKILIIVIFGPNAVATKSMTMLLTMFGARIFWSLVSVYFLAVNMRILGLLYVTKKQKLGWFSR